MYAAIGIVLLLVMVFGGFVITGGALGPVLEAIPHEMLIIGGASAAALVTGNSLHELKAIGGSLKKVFKGPKHTKQDHIDAIALTTKLMRLLRAEGPVALESHVQEPDSSTIFAEYPRLLANKPLIELICDPLTLLVVSSGSLDTHAIEEVMDNAMKTHFHHEREPQHALQGLADALPALGIVAAVLGVVKTMGSIDEPPAVLGGMIGSALVGTVLGVLLAYGIVGPLASRLNGIIEHDAQFYKIIRDELVAHLHGNAAQVSVEIGRGSVPSTLQPSFTQLEEALAAATEA
jgi:chemotaxis protein MotA